MAKAFPGPGGGGALVGYKQREGREGGLTLGRESCSDLFALGPIAGGNIDAGTVGHKTGGNHKTDAFGTALRRSVLCCCCSFSAGGGLTVTRTTLSLTLKLK